MAFQSSTFFDSMPSMKGVGADVISVIECGSAGTSVCCQTNGYSIDWTASTHSDSTLLIIEMN